MPLRNEHNSTMARPSTIRMAVVESRDFAGIRRMGLQGKRGSDATRRFRPAESSRCHSAVRPIGEAGGTDIS